MVSAGARSCELLVLLEAPTSLACDDLIIKIK